MKKADLFQNEHVAKCSILYDDRGKLSCPFTINDETLCILNGYLEDGKQYDDLRMMSALIAKVIINAHKGDFLIALSCLQAALIYMEGLKRDMERNIGILMEKIKEQSIKTKSIKEN